MSTHIVKNTTPFKSVIVNECKRQIPVDWEVECVKNSFKKLPKGKRPAGSADKNGIYDFYASGRKIKKSNTYDLNDNMLLLTTGGRFITHYANGKFSYSTDVLALKSSNESLQKFFYYLLKCMEKTYNNNFFKGMALKHLQVKDFMESHFPIPSSKDEQNKIASYLSSIEHKLEIAEKAVELLETILFYYSRKLTSGKLRITADNKLVPNADFKTVTINERKRKIPVDWEVKCVKDSFEKLPKGKRPAGSANKDGIYDFYTSGRKIKKTNTYDLNDNMLLLATGGTFIIHYANGKFSYSTDVLALKTPNESLQMLFYYLLKHMEKTYNDMFFKGMGLKHLQVKDFMESNFPIPPSKEEQDKIVSYLSSIEKKLEAAKNAVEKYEKELKWSSKALLFGEYILQGN